MSWWCSDHLHQELCAAFISRHTQRTLCPEPHPATVTSGTQTHPEPHALPPYAHVRPGPQRRPAASAHGWSTFLQERGQAKGWRAGEVGGGWLLHSPGRRARQDSPPRISPQDSSPRTLSPGLFPQEPTAAATSFSRSMAQGVPAALPPQALTWGCRSTCSTLQAQFQ